MKISKTGFFRYQSVGSLKQLEKTKFSYLDFVQADEDIKNHNTDEQLSRSRSSNLPSMTVSVFTKEVDPNDIKKLNVDKYGELYEDILNFYVDNQLQHEIDLDIDYSENHRKILGRVLSASNIVAKKSRIGPANIAILSQKMYDRLKEYSTIHFSFYPNPTDIHNDKIIVIRLTETLSDIGVCVLSDVDLDNLRYLKLIKIAKKMNIKIPPQLEINYTIVPIGNKFKNTICVINLLNNSD